MLHYLILWRTFFKDRIFVLLFSLTVVTLVSALMQRQPSLERTPVPLSLDLFFSVVNIIFALLSLRREPLLAYMFLTATILLNGSLFFFFYYLASIQAS